MTEVRFYHLTQTSLEAALPALLEKVLERDWRAVVMTGSAERAEALTQQLWISRDFLPHGNVRDGNAADQPVWLTDADENPNKANVLMLTDGASTQNAASYDLVCEIFDGGDGDAVEASRERWKNYKAAGFDLTYWQQGERGWEKK